MFGKAKITKIIGVDGMSCMHCASKVESTLNALDGVASADVDLDNKTATVKMKKDIDDSVFTKAVEDAGFSVTSIK